MTDGQNPPARSASERDRDPGAAKHRAGSAGTPTWVKVFGVAFAVVVLLVVVLMIVGGEHGPGRHTDAGGEATPAGNSSGHAPPPGVDHGLP
jgi:hypothetical protein